MRGGDLQAAGLREGDVLAGKYRVERVLGAGGMGVVVAAHHEQLGTKVAIKFLLPTMLQNHDAVARFAREARSAAIISSDHIVRVLDVGTLDSGAPYMVMEFLEGEDLGEWLQKRGPLPIELAIEFVLQTCVAVADAHRLGIVHRDLKPANLFCVRRSDGQLIIKVLDFGISKLSDLGRASEAQAVSVTKTSSVMGSPLYMSPEQIQSSKNVDARTDLWALGVVLFELLAGKVPFEGEEFGEVLVKIAVKPPSPLRAYRPDVPPGLEAVIHKCLEKDRDRRYATVADLALALLPFASKRAKAFIERIAGIAQSTRKSSNPLALPTLGVSTPLDPSTQLAGETAGAWSERQARGPSKKALLGATALALALAAVGGLAAFRRFAQDKPSAVASPLIAPPAETVATQGCLPGSTQCRDATPLVCNDARQWSAGAVTAGQCGAECTPGSSLPRCNDKTPQTCDAQGHWVDESPCPSICSAGACKSAASQPPAPPTPRATCTPPCRTGFVCSPHGQCVSACNPPCAAGQRCTAEGSCISATSAPSPPAQDPPQKTQGQAQGGCVPPCRTGYTCDSQSHCVR